MNLILNIDSHVTTALHNLIPHTIFFDYIFAFLSLQGSSIFIWIVMIAVLLFIEEKKDKRLFIVPFIINLALAHFVSEALKFLFHRPRPSILTTHISWLTCPTNYSFPSGHAAVAFAAATFLVSFDPKRKWLYIFVACLIAFSRIYLNCHYLLDVVAGAIIGLLIAKLVLWTIAKFKKDYFL